MAKSALDGDLAWICRGVTSGKLTLNTVRSLSRLPLAILGALGD